MHTIFDIIHAADSVSQRVAEADASPSNGPELSPTEQAESIIAKNRVLKILSRSIRDVQAALNPVPTTDPDDTDDRSASVAMDIAADQGRPPADVIRDCTSAGPNGLGGQAPTLKKMAEDVGPIVDTFNAVLVKPYLKNYNAITNTVPIIGLKGDNVMYSQTKSSGISGVVDSWSVFGEIPKDVNINSSKAVHFFPYKGDFCMSVGTAIYYKKHRVESDPVIKTAVDNWPNLYHQNWEKFGDKCLPTANARSVLPFARLVGKDIRFHLVALMPDGQLKALDGDLADGGCAYTELKNVSGDKPEGAKTLKIQQAAYWNGNIVALDDANNTWNLNVDFENHTFTAGDQQAVDPLLELTATDIGPVGVKKDGWIYRRRLETVNDPTDKQKGDKKIGWERWMEQKGVSHLGVASPGVMLNLEVLTRSLRERYMSTQTSIYPVVNKIQAFTINHELFLKKQLEAAKEYQKNPDNAAKQKMAIKEAKKLVIQTRVWASIMRKQSNHTKTSVGLMGEELSSVRTQLEQQLILLRDRLVSLKAQIEALKKAEAKMDSGFWWAIGAMVLGIGLAILGVATGVGVIALGVIGGALFVGGLVAATYFGIQSSKIAGQIRGLEAEMQGVTTAISDLQTIAEKFKHLDAMYQTLNQFWGRMFNAGDNLKLMNDAVAEQIGLKILEDTTAIEAAIEVVREMKTGCAVYLAVLNKTGIKIAVDDSDDEDDSDDDGEAADVDITPIDYTVDPTFKTVRIFNEQVDRATQALDNGQFYEYRKHLETADLIETYTIELGMAPEAISQALNAAVDDKNKGAADLFDNLAKLDHFTALGTAMARAEPQEAADILDVVAGFTVSQVTAIPRAVVAGIGIIGRAVEPPPLPLFFGNQGLAASAALLAIAMPFSPNHPGSGMLNGVLGEARRNVIEMLDKTLELAAVSEDWMKQIPVIPVSDQEIARFHVFRENALASCKLARKEAALANNTFAEFNRMARREQQRLESEITALKDKIESLQAQCRRDIEQAQAPVFLNILSFGVTQLASTLIQDQIMARIHHETEELVIKIRQCDQALQCGNQYMGNSKTWIELCEKTNNNLGSIYNTLTSVKYGIQVDAQAFKEIGATQWNQIRKEAEEVKTLLVPRQSVGMLAMDLIEIDLAADLRSDTALLNIASPDARLLQQLCAQASNSNIVWENLDKLNKLTYTEDIVSYFDAASQQKVTLRQVIGGIKRTYIQTAVLHYETVEQISVLALLQKHRSNNLAMGKVSPHLFLKGTFNSITTARKAAARVKAHMAESSLDINMKLEMVKASISELKKAITDANLDMARRDKAYHDKVTGMIVEGCLRGFATGGLVAAAALAAYSGVTIASIPALIAAGSVVIGGTDSKAEKKRKEEGDDGSGTSTSGKTSSSGGNTDYGTDEESDDEIDGSDEGDDEIIDEFIEVADKKDTLPSKDKGYKDAEKRVAAAQDTWAKLRAIMGSTKDALNTTPLGKALFNEMSLAELSMLVQLVKTATIVMERTVEAVEQLSKPLDDLIVSVSDVADILADMEAHCNQYHVESADVPLKFGKRDAEAVMARWVEIFEACQVWLDIFNGQRISPMTFSVA